jgi:glucose/arabinose dehydrogenase
MRLPQKSSLAHISETIVGCLQLWNRLPPPTKAALPTVHIAPAKRWPDGAQPTAASGLAVNAFATGLSHPRWLYALPNGDILVAESDGPPRPEDAKGVKGFVFRIMQKRAGAGTPSANRITLLRDTNGTGSATKTVFLEGTGSSLPDPYRSGAFIGQHGSWNRKPLSGYKVIFVPFSNGRPSGQPVDVLTGFVDQDGKALGRPVGVAIDKTGALLVADDVGNTVWRVTPAAKAPSARHSSAAQ